jgi:ABC-type transporter Mla subunit MlaD
VLVVQDWNIIYTVVVLVLVLVLVVFFVFVAPRERKNDQPLVVVVLSEVGGMNGCMSILSEVVLMTAMA